MAKIDFSALSDGDFNKLKEKSANLPCTVKIIWKSKRKLTAAVCSKPAASAQRNLSSCLSSFQGGAHLAFFQPAAACNSPTNPLFHSIETLIERALGCVGCATKLESPPSVRTGACVEVAATLQAIDSLKDIDAKLRAVEWAASSKLWSLDVGDVDTWNEADDDAEHEALNTRAGILNAGSSGLASDNAAHWVALSAAGVMGVAIIGSARHFARRRSRFKVVTDEQVKA